MTALELINKIAPQHDRTSCSDDYISNGFVKKTNGFEDGKSIDNSYNARCARCGLLQIMKGDIEVNGDIEHVSFYLRH